MVAARWWFHLASLSTLPVQRSWIWHHNHSCITATGWMPWLAIVLTAEVNMYIGILSVRSHTGRNACSLQVNTVLIDFVGMREYPEELKWICRTSAVPYNVCFYNAASNHAVDVGKSHLCCFSCPNKQGIQRVKSLHLMVRNRGHPLEAVVAKRLERR